MDMIAYQYTWSRLELHKLSLHKAPDVAHAKAGSAAFAGASGHLRVINGQNCPAKAPASRWKLWTMRSLTRSQVPRISQDLIILGYSVIFWDILISRCLKAETRERIGFDMIRLVWGCDMLWHVVTLQSQAMKAFCLAISCHAEAFAERSSRLASWVWRG